MNNNKHTDRNSHYNNLEIQPFDYIMANKLGFAEGNIIKYVSRYLYKNGLEDLLKARDYLDTLIQKLEEHDDEGLVEATEEKAAAYLDWQSVFERYNGKAD